LVFLEDLFFAEFEASASLLAPVRSSDNAGFQTSPVRIARPHRDADQTEAPLSSSGGIAAARRRAISTLSQLNQLLNYHLWSAPVASG
jgi:hypothetical protein